MVRRRATPSWTAVQRSEQREASMSPEKRDGCPDLLRAAVWLSVVVICCGSEAGLCSVFDLLAAPMSGCICFIGRVCIWCHQQDLRSCDWLTDGVPGTRKP